MASRSAEIFRLEPAQAQHRNGERPGKVEAEVDSIQDQLHDIEAGKVA